MCRKQLKQSCELPTQSPGDRRKDWRVGPLSTCSFVDVSVTADWNCGLEKLLARILGRTAGDESSVFQASVRESGARFRSSLDSPCMSSTITAKRRLRVSTLTPARVI